MAKKPTPKTNSIRAELVPFKNGTATSRSKNQDEHFANGGTLASWRGRAHTYRDKKAVGNKNYCRQSDNSY